MRFITVLALAAVFATSVVGSAEEAVETHEVDDLLLQAAVNRVDGLLPGLTSAEFVKVRERAAAIQRAAEERQRSTVEGHDRKHEQMEAAWKARWSQPNDENPAETETIKSIDTPELPRRRDLPPENLATRLNSEVPEVENEGIVIEVDQSEPTLSDRERELLVTDGIAAFGRALQDASNTFSLRPSFLLCVMRIESNFDPVAVSHTGAVGLMQLMPNTAEELGSNPYDLTENIHGGAKLIDAHLDHYAGDVALAMAAYNAGPGAVERFHGVPPYPETQNYVARIVSSCGDPRP